MELKKKGPYSVGKKTNSHQIRLVDLWVIVEEKLLNAEESWKKFDLKGVLSLN